MDLEEPETEKENNINSQNSAPGQERDDIANEDEMFRLNSNNFNNINLGDVIGGDNVLLLQEENVI